MASELIIVMLVEAMRCMTVAADGCMLVGLVVRAGSSAWKNVPMQMSFFFRAVMDRICFESVDKLQPVSYEVCDVLDRRVAWSA